MITNGSLYCHFYLKSSVNATLRRIIIIFVSFFFLLSFANAQNEFLSSSDQYLKKVLRIRNHFEHDFDQKTNLFDLVFLSRDYKSKLDNDYEFYPDSILVKVVSLPDQKYYYTYSDQNIVVSEIKKILDNGTWKNDVLEEFTYDDNGNLSVIVWKQWNETLDEWINLNRATYSYTEDGYLLLFIDEVWASNVWVYNSKLSFTYDVANHPVVFLSQIWNNGEWVNINKTIMTYNEMGNMVGLLGELWYANAWRNDVQFTFEYDASGNQVSQLYEKWDDGIWKNVSHETMEYNSSNKMITKLTEVWEDSTWVNNLFVEFNYDNVDYLTFWISKNWLNNDWVNLEKVSYSYGQYGVVENELLEEWDGAQWESSSMKKYEYDEFGNALTSDFYTWEDGTMTQNKDGALMLKYSYGSKDVIFSGYHVDAYYSSVLVGSNSISDSDKQINCYPNPAKEDAVLKIDLKKNSKVEIVLLDMSGKQVSNLFSGVLQKGNNMLDLNLHDLSSGTYIIKVKDGYNYIIKKLIKL
jgi:hypothetical protein